MYMYIKWHHNNLVGDIEDLDQTAFQAGDLGSDVYIVLYSILWLEKWTVPIIEIRDTEESIREIYES